MEEEEYSVDKHRRIVAQRMVAQRMVAQRMVAQRMVCLGYSEAIVEELTKYIE